MSKIYLKGAFCYREDTLENWITHNPVLEKGEVSLISEAASDEWLKIGDGKTQWVDLPWKKSLVSDSVANAFRGKASGNPIDISDVSPLPHSIKVSVVKNLLFASSITDSDFGYAVTEGFKLERGKKYRYSIELAETPTTVLCPVITSSEWKGDTSPAYAFSSPSEEFENDHIDTAVMYIPCAADNVMSVSIEETEFDASSVIISVKDSKGSVTTVSTDASGTATVQSTHPFISLSANANAILSVEYNRDVEAVLGDINSTLVAIIDLQNKYIGGEIS